MRKSIELDQAQTSQRFYKSDRLTIQQDPILYNDEIASFFGAKPDLWKNKELAFHLLFSACGPAQWRLNGIDADRQLATYTIRKVPLTPMMKLFGTLLISLGLILVLLLTVKHPLVLFLLIFGISISYFINKIE